MRFNAAPGAATGVVVVGYAATTAAVCYLLVQWDGPDSALALWLVPILLAATIYPRWVPFTMLAMLALGAIWATYYLSSRFATSLQTIVSLVVTMGVVIEVMQRVAGRQRQTERARLRYAQRLEVLHEVDRAVLGASSPDRVAQAVLDHVHRLIPCEWSLVALLEFQTQSYRRLATVEQGGKYLPEGELFPVTSNPVFTSLEQRQVFLSTDLATLPSRTAVQQHLLERGIHSLMAVPLVNHGQTIGSLSMGARAFNYFTQEHIEIAQEVADGLAIALAQAQLRARLAQTNEELRDALRTKDDMIANVSHELRTPLTHVIGYAELLQAGTLGDLTPEQRHAIDVMGRQGRVLTRLVDVLLSLQTLAHPEDMDWEAVSLVELVEGTVSLWRASSTTARLTLKVEAQPGTPPVWGDALRLQQALEHLLDNALKFTSEAGTVTVQVWPAGNEARLSVTDTGIGIPRDHLQKIFRRFYRVEEPVTRRRGGMGLGLSLVQQIVALHKGRIWAESEGEGQGATFTIALPAHTGKQPGIGGGMKPAPTTGGDVRETGT